LAGVIKRLDKDTLKKEIINNLKTLYRKDVSEATLQMVYQAVAYAVKDDVIDSWLATQKAYDKADAKRVYYLSMEFLVGRALGNTMLALKEEQVIREAVEELGFDLTEIEDEERDPALGNGGLGRLAACFLDSLSTLNYPAYGCGIRYHYGMFRQKIENGYQKEIPDEWLKDGYPFEIKRDEHACEGSPQGTARRTGHRGAGNRHASRHPLNQVEIRAHDRDRRDVETAVRQEIDSRTCLRIGLVGGNLRARRHLRVHHDSHTFSFVTASVAWNALFMRRPARRYSFFVNSLR